MRRFEFRLEKVLELREFGEKQAEAVLAAKAGACSLLEQKLRENAEATLAASRERFRAGGGAGDFAAAERYALRLKQERDKLAKALALAEAELDVARGVYVKARVAREALTKLREREEAEWRRDALAEETATLDDLGAQSRERARRGRETAYAAQLQED